jgi:hypothetical protein
MLPTNCHRLAACALWCGVLVAGFVVSPAGCDQRPKQSNANKNANVQERQPVAEALQRKRTGESGELNFMVDPGDEDDGFDYYFASFCELGLTTDPLCTASPTPASPQKKASVTARDLDLKQTLQYLGYEGLTPKDLEDMPSTDLMSRFPGDLLSSAFFAPKITDVSKSLKDAVDPNINVGWRKLIRLKARSGSPAQQKGVAAGFLLFNKFQGTDYSKNPFRPADDVNESKATQLILVRADASALKRPVYFFVFGPLSQNSKLITFLTATFDARAPNIVADNKYYVPHACAECHGAKIFNINDDKQYARLKLNYLDTDHWFDRLNDDFAVVKAMPFGVLYDGEKDETTPKFAAAFDVIRSLNTEIRAQNAKVEPSPAPAIPSFQLRAVDKWLQLHASNTSHQDVFARSLPNPAGAQWNATTMPDKELLPLLNQYCYRCHSSLKYNIFDRPEVVRRGGSSLTDNSIIARLHKTPVTERARMPQDRNLDCTQKWRDDKQRMHNLICALNPGAPCPTPTPMPPAPCPTPP